MAITYTENYNLGKQEDHTDKFDMSVITDNADKIDEALTGKVDKATRIAGLDLSTNISVAELQTALNIEDGANKTVVDSSLSSTSTNPVQNKEIYEALQDKADKSEIPPMPIETIQRNGTDITPVSGVVNITVPTTAEDVSALPDTIKYATALSLTINASTFIMTGQLKDQDGNNIGTAQEIDLPLESMVVSGSYDSQTKKIILELKNGEEIEFSVADLVSGLQTALTAEQLNAVNSGITQDKVSSINAHLASTSNPHSVTKSQVGLGNVDNTSDLDKPISTAAQEALDAKGTYSKPSGGIPKSDLASDVRAILDMGQVHNVSVLTLSPFQKGRITNGTVYTDYKYRCISTNIIYTEKDITLSISNTSYKFSIQRYDSSGTYISGSDSGWITTSISINANTYFRIMIARATESSAINKEPIDVAYMASLVKCTYAYLSISDNVINALSIGSMQAYNSLSARLDAHLQAMNAIGRNVLYTGINAPTTGSNALTKGTVINVSSGTVTVNEDWSFTVNGTISGASIPVSNLYTGSRTTDSAQKDYKKWLRNGEYAIIGSNNVATLQIYGYNTTSDTPVAIGDTNNTTSEEVSYCVIDDTYAYNHARFYLKAGTYNNATFKPMIVPMALYRIDSSTDYVPPIYR